MRKQHVPPGVFQLCLRQTVISQLFRKHCQRLSIVQRRFRAAVACLYAALGRVAARREKVKLLRYDGQPVPHGFGLAEVVSQSAKFDGGIYRPGHHVQRALYVAARRSAAVISYAVKHHAGLKPA